ncbi:GNAT family N-acetyltransferase [Candidatus Micrarchaeota archaeon]|nr:GNAT family N-acetyltransferase [Candidatus Micrarchaeota archaeon]
MEIEIRKANKADLPNLLSCFRELIAQNKEYQPYIYIPKKDALELHEKFLLKRMRSPKASVFIAEADGKFAGMVHCAINKVSRVLLTDKEGYVDTLFVDKKYRKKGIGLLLMKTALAWFKKKKMKICSLTVNVKNPGARNLYEKAGFRITILKMHKKLKV